MWPVGLADRVRATSQLTAIQNTLLQDTNLDHCRVASLSGRLVNLRNILRGVISNNSQRPEYGK